MPYTYHTRFINQPNSDLESVTPFYISLGYNVTSLRLSDYINNVVATRLLPHLENARIPPQVVMKMDIEGAEREVMLDLLISGALPKVDLSLTEWHEGSVDGKDKKEMFWVHKGIESIIKLRNKYGLSSKFSVEFMDDETYGDDGVPLPHCHIK